VNEAYVVELLFDASFDLSEIFWLDMVAVINGKVWGRERWAGQAKNLKVKSQAGAVSLGTASAHDGELS
jgi:hypothetical protein